METSVIPKLETPQPGRLQNLAMRAAGLLLHQETPASTIESLVTTVGGYSAEVDSTGSTIYKAEVKPGVVMSLGDETTTSTPQQKYRSGADFYDALGTDLGVAATQTLNRQRQEGHQASTVRGKVARGLARYATKRVGVQSYIKP